MGIFTSPFFLNIKLYTYIERVEFKLKENVKTSVDGGWKRARSRAPLVTNYNIINYSKHFS